MDKGSLNFGIGRRLDFPERVQKGSLMSNVNINQIRELNDPSLLSFLDHRQVRMIDEALSALGEYGELRLVVEKGRLRFIITQKSFDALKWQPGEVEE